MRYTEYDIDRNQQIHRGLKCEKRDARVVRETLELWSHSSLVNFNRIIIINCVTTRPG